MAVGGWSATNFAGTLHRVRRALFSEWWSWTLFGVSALGFILSGQWLPWGWLIFAVPIQAIYFVYGLRTRQYGFCPASVFTSAIGFWNFYHAVQAHNR